MMIVENKNNVKRKTQEQLILLLTGKNNEYKLTLIHLEKELFLLNNFMPNMKNTLKFKKGIYGPELKNLNYIIKKPVFYKNNWITSKHNSKYTNLQLTKKGIENFYNLHDELNYNNQYEIISAVKMMHKLYDKIKPDSLLFLMFETYPEFTIDTELKNTIFDNRSNIAINLYKDGFITYKRYKELTG